MTVAPLLLLAISMSAAGASTQPAGAAQAAPSTQKAVLVTGASSGFGRRIAERLAADGHFVYAGARKDADIAALSAIPNVKGLRLDVTKPAEIAAAVRIVTEGGRGLYGLVNNAGVAGGGPVGATTDAHYEYVMDVNVLGVVRVTRAFLPLIQAAKGRVVNIGSLSGLAATRGLAFYAMSKHAIEAFTDSLAADVAADGVAVSVIEPGNYRTELIANLLKLVKESGASDPALVKRVEDRAKAKAQDKDPEEVALAVKRALFDEKPQRRYLVVPNKGEGDFIIKNQVEKLAQLNESQAFALSRDELVALLDAALAQARPKEARPRADARP